MMVISKEQVPGQTWLVPINGVWYAAGEMPHASGGTGPGCAALALLTRAAYDGIGFPISSC